MSDNLKLYNAVRNVPQNAKKPIQAGRLKGYTDINPMWRIKTLTEQFGMCGVGWYVNIVDKWLEQGADGQVMAFCLVALYIKSGDNWSAPIVGIGGAAAVAKERNGLYTDDECFKKAYTDAISVACKMLGFGADVYWEKDTNKYSAPAEAAAAPAVKVICDKCGRTILRAKKSDGRIIEPEDFKKLLGGLCKTCYDEAQNVNTN